jgi:hypothetical protein
VVAYSVWISQRLQAAQGTSERPGLANESVNPQAQEDQYINQRRPPKVICGLNARNGSALAMSGGLEREPLASFARTRVAAGLHVF